MELTRKFHPLLGKYGRKLGYEDAEEDLIVDFIEWVKKLNLSNIYDSSDGALTNYISRYIAYFCDGCTQFWIKSHAVSTSKI